MGLGLSPRTLMAAVLAVCPFATAPARADPIRAAESMRATEAGARPYYVEFRVAENGVYGHSYIAYGRLDARGQPATATYVDIHPTGDIPSMVLGHFIPMDAATTPEEQTLGRKIVSRFRRPLTAAEYHRLNTIIARTRAAGHAWSILAYNCNDFVADVARGIGMQTPTTLSLPYDFVPWLKAMNQHAPRPVHALASARSDAPSSKARTSFPARPRVGRPDSARREAGRSPGRATVEIRTDHQS
jgi:hypothetical protein